MKLITVLLLSGSFQLFASSVNDDQQRTVSGRVTDEKGQALPGVNILEKGTTNGQMADIDGKFTIKVTTTNPVLVISFVGYTSKEVTVGSQTTVDVSLAESAIGLDEIVVVGYGTQQKRAVSGSVANVTEKNFNQGITRTAADFIQGKVAGLTITTSTGDVTAEQTMRLRGTSSLIKDEASQPFVVIDGVPGLSLSSVAPQDIESISVLKDASAAAIYGSRSASGVILITTKKGTKDRTTVDYNAYVAIDKVSNKPDVLTASEYRQWAADNNKDISVFDKGANTDWFGEIMRTGVSQNHDLSISGAGTSNSYRVSVSYLDQEGVVMDNNQKKINTRFSVNQKALKDHLDISISGGLNQRDYQQTDTRNFILAYNVVPTIPVYNADGTWWDSDEYDQGNPVRNMTLNKFPKKRSQLYVNGKATVTILPGLTAGLNLYKERESYDEANYTDSRTRYGRADNGIASRRFWTRDKNLLETTVNYAKKFGSHDINVLGGYSYEDFLHQEAFAQNRYFVTNIFGYNNLSAGEKLLSGDVTSDANMYKLISFFGRVNYSFMDRYILSAALRRDGSSKFGANNRWGTFPSVSAAWRIIDEPFMSSFKGTLFDELKLRAGYGVSGNQSGLDPYQSMSLYGSSGTYFDNGAWHTSYAVSQNPNPDLKWETTSMFNVGIDFSILNARISGTVEYYNKNTNDLLYQYAVPVPPYMYATMTANVGSMSNKGIEFTLNGDIIRKANFRWTMSVNGAHNENEITSLSNAEYSTKEIKTGSAWVRGGSTNTTHIIKEGYQVGQFYGPKCLGIDENGNYIIQDTDGDGKITVSDYTFIGKAQPLLTYGINNTFTYKNFDLSFFIRGVYGNDVLNFSKMSYANLQWLPGANVLKPALTMGLKQSPVFNSYYIEDGSFARLDNMTLAYSIVPKDLLGVSRIRIYGTTHNLLTITKYKGVDPEVPMNGLDPGIEGREYYPKSKTYMLGVNVTF